MESTVERIIIERTKKQTREKILAAAQAAPADVAALLEGIAARVFDADFDVTALQRSLRPTRTALERLAEEVGSTPWAFISEQRMRTALFVFETHPEIDVSDVALAVGWKPETVQNFGPAFFKWQGRWPLEVQEAAGRAAALEEAKRRRGLWYRCAAGQRLEAAEREELLASLRGQEGFFERDFPEFFETLARMLEERLENRGFEATRRLCAGLRTRMTVLFEALSRRSREVGRRDRKRGLEMAELALVSVEASGERLGEGEASARALGWARLGNARRLAADPVGAEEAFARADGVVREGDVGDGVRADLLKFKGTHRMFLRRLPEAKELLDAAIELGRTAGARKVVLDALIQRATVNSGLGDLGKSIEDLRSASEKLAQGSDELPANDRLRLSSIVSGNLVLALALTDEDREARMLLPEAMKLAEKTQDRAYWYQLIWIDGSLRRKDGELSTAEALLEEARQGFIEIDDPGLTAIASLDLALLYHERGKVEATLRAASEALPALEALDIPEALGAYETLQKAIATRRMTIQVVQKARRLLLRLPG